MHLEELQVCFEYKAYYMYIAASNLEYILIFRLTNLI